MISKLTWATTDEELDQMVAESMSNAIDNGYESDMQNWDDETLAFDMVHKDATFDEISESILYLRLIPAIKRWRQNR